MLFSASLALSLGVLSRFSEEPWGVAQKPEVGIQALTTRKAGPPAVPVSGTVGNLTLLPAACLAVVGCLVPSPAT